MGEAGVGNRASSTSASTGATVSAQGAAFPLQTHQTGWLVLESASVSYGKATPYFPVLDLLRRYAHVDEGDAPAPCAPV